jgi:hypothetical protein
LAVTLGFLGAAVGLFGQANWWRTVAIAASALSVIGLALFWTNPATSPVFSALVFNLVVLLALLVLHWPPVTSGVS